MIEKIREYIRHKIFMIKLINKSIRYLSKNRVCGIMMGRDNPLLKGSIVYKHKGDR